MQSRYNKFVAFVLFFILGFGAVASAQCGPKYHYERVRYRNLATTTTVAKTTTSTAPAVTTTTAAVSTGLTDLPGWKLEFNEGFDKTAAEGQLLSTYSDFSAYPAGWKDTSRNGTYDPGILSASGGDLVMDLHTNSEGEHLVAAPEPKVNNGSTNQLYGRYQVRFKADQIAGYKAAWLLWSQSDQWSDGEIDFPEGNLNGSIN